MKTNPFKIRNALAIFVLLTSLNPSFPARAEMPKVSEVYSRKGQTELYGIGQYLHSETLSFNSPITGPDASLKVDDTGLGGFGVGYFFNDFLSIRGDFMFGGTTVRGSVPTEDGGTVNISQDFFIQTGRLNLDYTIMNRRLAPFVTAGIGYQYIETELQRLPPVNTCWWDPWWGWICDTSKPQASDTEFTWNAGAGLRWNVTDQFLVKAMCGANWVDYSHAKGITTQIEAVFSIGWSF